MSTQLRIILNISSINYDLEKFNHDFLGQNTNYNNQILNQNTLLSYLNLSSCSKELSNNRVIIFLNAYCNFNTQFQLLAVQSAAQLLVIGYLMASVLFFHNHEILGHHGIFAKIMGKLGVLLKVTDILQLQQSVKYTSGFIKKPYLMCFCHFPSQSEGETNYHEHFRQIFKYQQGNQCLNEAVDTLIDYFPERSALYLNQNTDLSQSIEKIGKLGSEYICSIMGRQMFNFEITGSALENLCFELCEHFNKLSNNENSINLVTVYNKIIINQKSQLVSTLTQKYHKIIQELTNKLPLENNQIISSYIEIQKFIRQESLDCASNCMTFYQYVQIYAKLEAIFAKRFKSLIHNNRQLLRNAVNQCYQLIEDDDQYIRQLTHNLTNINSVFLLQATASKLSMFIEQSVPDFTVKDLLIRQINKNTELVAEYLNDLHANHLQEVRIVQERNCFLQFENRAHVLRSKELQNEFMYLNAINADFKQKLLGLNGNHQFENTDGLILALKTKIMDLELEIVQKNSEITKISEVLDKFQIQFSKKFFKQKFSKTTQHLINEVNQKCNNIYSLLTELRKTQQFYRNIEGEFQLKKELINKEKEEDMRAREQQKQKSQQLKKQRTVMEEIIAEAKKSIEVLNQVQQEYKNKVNELESACNHRKCLLAEMEGEFQKWKKALELTVTFAMTGKIDKLKDFYKVTSQQQLKGTLKPLFSKK